jgi:hypothetical protein
MESSKMGLYAASSFAGIVRVLIGKYTLLKWVGFPIEHPIDSIKTQWQTKPYHKHEFSVSI